MGEPREAEATKGFIDLAIESLMLYGLRSTMYIFFVSVHNQSEILTETEFEPRCLVKSFQTLYKLCALRANTYIYVRL